LFFIIVCGIDKVPVTKLETIMPTSKQLKRQKIGIVKNDTGSYMIMPPQPKGLVLSGGGAKGIAYGGMIDALDKRGYLQQLTHVSGASAGAMTASILAVGMSAQNIGKLVSALDPIQLLDKSGVSRVRARGDRFRNMLDVIYMVQIKQHLESSIKEPIPEGMENHYDHINNKLVSYQEALAKQGLRIGGIDDIIKISLSLKGLEKLDRAFKTLPRRESFTLGDLKLLRELLPAENQHLIKNLTVAVTNQTKNALELYSEASNPDQSIAEVVQWSGAHPALFTPKKNAKGDYVADGGILDNMPEIDGLHREEVLCVKAEADSSFAERVNKAEQDTPEALSVFARGLDYMVQWGIGGKWLNATASLLNREKVFHHIDNMIYINTGEITTVNTSPTQVQKEHAIKNGFEQTMAVLDNHRRAFTHPLLAVLYLGFAQLDNALLDFNTDPVLFHAAAQAKGITFLQEQMVKEMQAEDYTDIRGYLKKIEDILETDAKMTPLQKEQALALCHKQVNFLSEGKLLNYLNDVAEQESIAKQPGWGTRALNFILRPIEWILSYLSPASPPKEISPTEVELIAIPQSKEFKGRFKQVLERSLTQVEDLQLEPDPDVSVGNNC
jgi:VPS inhibitor protein D